MIDSRLLTIKDVMEITRLGRTTIYEFMRRGKLPYLRIGRSVRIRHDALNQWLLTLEEDARADLGQGW